MSQPAVAGRVDHALLGIGLVLVANLMFSVVDASVKWLVVFGYPALQLTFMRYVGHFVISSGRIAQAGKTSELLGGKYTGLSILRAGLLLYTTIANFVALKYIPLTLTATIFFSAPIIVCLMSNVVLGEGVGRWRWFGITLGFIGVLVTIRPFGAEFHWAALLSLSGVTGFAFYLLLTRHLAGAASPEKMQFYAGVVGTTLMLPFALYFWEWPQNWWHWVLMIGLGIFAWGGHEMLTRGYRFADASLLAPYSYSFMIYLTLWSIMLFDQYPDGWTLVGAALIVASGLLIWFRERSRMRQPAPTD